MATDERSTSPHVVPGGVPPVRVTAPPTAPPTMTVQELAAIMGRDPATIRRHCVRGYIPGAEKIGRDWLIPLAGAEQYAGDDGYTPYQALMTPREENA